MVINNIIMIPKVPERLRLAWFTGTEAEQEELETLESDISGLLQYVFDSVFSGAVTCAWWDRQKVTSTTGRHIIQRCALHRSSRHNGLQLSYYDILDGSDILPVMHVDFEHPDYEKFVRESGYNGGQVVHMAIL